MIVIYGQGRYFDEEILLEGMGHPGGNATEVAVCSRDDGHLQGLGSCFKSHDMAKLACLLRGLLEGPLRGSSLDLCRAGW